MADCAFIKKGQPMDFAYLINNPREISKKQDIREQRFNIVVQYERDGDKIALAKNKTFTGCQPAWN
jgi:hypothetical protein